MGEAFSLLRGDAKAGNHLSEEGEEGDEPARRTEAFAEGEGNEDERKKADEGDGRGEDSVCELKEGDVSVAPAHAGESVQGGGDDLNPGEIAGPAHQVRVGVELEEIEEEEPKRDVLQGERGLLQTKGGVEGDGEAEFREDKEDEGAGGEERHPKEYMAIAVGGPCEKTDGTDEEVDDIQQE